MKVLDPGHRYALASIDGDAGQVLSFVKREGPGYPGNAGSHPGTTTQEVLRALLDRTLYVEAQISAPENALVLAHLREAILLLEQRAARRHGLPLETTAEGIEDLPACLRCGHVVCGHTAT